MRRSRLLACLALLGLAVLAPTAVRADVGPPPPAVVDWLEAEGADAALTADASPIASEPRARVEIGAATPVHLWTDEFLAGVESAQPVRHSDRWVAPVALNGVAVGAIVVTVDPAGQVSEHALVWNEDLGDALLKIQGATFILDEENGGWFRLGGEILTPITASAKDLLAGSVDIATYQLLLQGRQGGSDESAVTTPESGTTLLPVWIAAGLLAGVLGLVALVVWARRPEGNDD